MDVAHALDAGLERLEERGEPPVLVRPAPDAHRRRRDDAERALRAEEQGGRVDAAGVAGIAGRLDTAGRGDHLQAQDHVLDLPVGARLLPGRARGEPAAQRRVLERLREVPQREAVLLEV